MSAKHQELIHYARDMRKSMTKEERHLWFDFLKDFPCTVHRQKVLDRYIADFYIAKKKIVIEIDGSQHYDRAGQAYDSERDCFLQSKGITVLRYSNRDINQHFRGVCDDIWFRVFGQLPD